MIYTNYLQQKYQKLSYFYFLVYFCCEKFITFKIFINIHSIFISALVEGKMLKNNLKFYEKFIPHGQIIVFVFVKLRSFKNKIQYYVALSIRSAAAHGLN